MGKKFGWKQKKSIAMYLNRRQWNEEFYPPLSGPFEIEMEHIADSYLITEASSSSSPNYIITE
tara:strand:+ start:1879 stop:2067 length:189 start_codon:yes stop_codon:yes gene_type:complete